MLRITTALAAILLVAALFAGCTPPSPEADFSAAPATGKVPVEVKFTDQSRGVVNGWRWDFNSDGVVDSTEQNPTYTYQKAGEYTVGLAVSGPGGGDTEMKLGLLRFTSCLADFVAAPTDVVGYTKVQFTDLSQGEITSWAWDFDSNGVIESIERNPVHTYAANGKYSVTLTVFGPDCQSSLTKQDYISVSGCGS